MEPQNQRPVSKVEFWGMLAGVFTFIFAVHIAAQINEAWLHSYLTIFIVIALILCLFCFFKNFWHSNQ